LKYTDAGGNQVTFGVKEGGYLEDLLTGSGEGQRLVLVAAVPHRTMLTGSVKQGKHGTGRAYLGYSLYGLGQFGNPVDRVAFAINSRSGSGQDSHVER
jgi:hypothetical protein